MESNHKIEIIAASLHKQWCKTINDILYNKGSRNADDSIKISKDIVNQLKNKSWSSYDKLPEFEKKLYHTEVYNMLLNLREKKTNPK